MKSWMRGAMGAVFVGVLALQGCAGEVGPQGQDGAQGPQGNPGPQGEKGDPGEPAVDPSWSAVDKALFSLGGQSSISGMTAVEVASTGKRFLTLEGWHPEDDSAEVSSFTRTLRHDLTGNQKLRVDYARQVPLFGANLSFTLRIDGNLGHIEGSESVFGQPGGDMLSDRMAAILRQERLLNPHLIMRDVIATPSMATSAGYQILDGSLHHVLQVDDPVSDLKIYVNASTGRIAKLATMENDYVEGDTLVEVYYSGWERWAGTVLFPRTVVLAVGGKILHVEERTAVTTNGTLDPAIFAFPSGAAPVYVQADAERGARNHQFHEGFAGLGIPLDGLQALVTPVQISPGVHLLAGGSHNSLAIEQANGIVLVEAPLYEARANAILAWLSTTYPGKNVTHVIATHHHRDHVGSLRRFVRAGATIVLGEEVSDYFAGTFRAPRTIEPDALAQNPVAATIQAVALGAPVTLDDATNPVVAHRISHAHSSDMVIVYLSGQRVVFNSDLYNPGMPASPFSLELKQRIDDLGLAVDTMAGGHGGVGTYQQFLEALGL